MSRSPPPIPFARAPTCLAVASKELVISLKQLQTNARDQRAAESTMGDAASQAQAVAEQVQRKAFEMAATCARSGFA